MMLADVSEAACRTLDHPSVSRLEKFISGLIKGKMEAGQLDNCNLTLRDLHTIQDSFVTTLAGYYHSRIKYPNQKDPDEKQAGEKPAEQEASQEKDTGKKSVQQGTPAVKGITPEIRNYLQIDLGIKATEQNAEKPNGDNKEGQNE